MTTEDFENSNEVHFNVEITAKNAAFPTLKKRKRLIDEISGSSLSDSPTDDEIDPSLIYRMQGIRQGVLSVVEKFNKVGKGKYFEVVSKDNKVAENDDNFDTNSGAKPSASFHETIMAKKLYASQNELVANKFPLFTAGEIRLGAHPANSSFNWMKLMPQTAKISQRVFGLDCEMVRTIAGLELGRVTVVEHLTLNKFSVVYDKIVKPIHPVLDYLTIYSGLTPKILNSPNAITLELAQSDVFCDLIKNGDVLVGHSLENDFSAMRVAISPNTIIIADTALIYQRSGGGKHGLSFLASNVLQREIQTSGSDGHDSAEDAIASLELVQIRAFGGVEEGYGGNGAAFDNFGEQVSQLKHYKFTTIFHFINLPTNICNSQRFNLVDVINNCEKGKMRGGKVTVVEDEGSGWLKSFSGTNCDCTQKASDFV